MLLPSASAIVRWSMTGLLLVAASSACRSVDPTHTFEVAEEARVRVTVNSAVPKFDGEIFTDEKVLEIRADPDDPETFLYDPTAFSLGDDGLYYVADTGNHRVAVFDPEGRLVRTIGREGDGPGLVLAYWGEAMAHQDPFQFNGSDLVAMRAALEKLAPTPEGRVARAARRSCRERAEPADQFDSSRSISAISAA